MVILQVKEEKRKKKKIYEKTKKKKIESSLKKRGVKDVNRERVKEQRKSSTILFNVSLLFSLN